MAVLPSVQSEDVPWMILDYHKNNGCTSLLSYSNYYVCQQRKAQCVLLFKIEVDFCLVKPFFYVFFGGVEMDYKKPMLRRDLNHKHYTFCGLTGQISLQKEICIRFYRSNHFIAL